ncbi:hypothetical protein [Haladaptatus sp. ZSTT2]|uniref:hypothetical protein n=1 Tax=Haladaptatus sp. ZSTT2 TaxID=3120515 RepID=UPI00300F4FAA
MNIIDATGQLRTLYAFPPILITFAAVLTGDSLPYTARPRYIIQNCASVIIGNIGAAIAVIIVSGARPSVAFVLLLAGILGGGLLLGSKVANRLTDVPIFGVTTLGGLALIGLATIVGGVTVISALAPILLLGILGVLLGAILLLTVRSV